MPAKTLYAGEKVKGASVSAPATEAAIRGARGIWDLELGPQKCRYCGRELAIVILEESFGHVKQKEVIGCPYCDARVGMFLRLANLARQQRIPRAEAMWLAFCLGRMIEGGEVEGWEK